MSARLVLIGAGRMGAALLAGWARSRPAYAIDVVEPGPPDAFRADAAQLGARLNPPAAPADVIVLAVKPQTFSAAPEAFCAWVGPQSTVISIMAGVPVAALRGLGAGAVVRAMPNTPGAIGKGVTAVFGADPGALAAAATLLAPLGPVEVLASESAIDIATAVSGSGPAYVFLLVEALAGAAVAQGLDEDVAMRLARRTVIGAGALLEADGTDAAGLRRAVTSPGGTTQAALGELMAEDGLGPVMRRAVAAAVRRARELAGA